MSKKPIRLALLWHMHQPYYILDNQARLPWVHLHAAKDYYEMLALLEEHPEVRCTVNFVPSLLVGMHRWINREVTDPVGRLLEVPAEHLDETDIQELIKWSLLLPDAPMTREIPRFAEARSVAAESEDGPVSIDLVRDLQVGFLLCWIGPIGRRRYRIAHLARQRTPYKDSERETVNDAMRSIVEQVEQSLASSVAKNIELSTTPFYHPILPILCDIADAAVSNPNAAMPDTRTGWGEDAELQLEAAREYGTGAFGAAPIGCWPSEGAVSEKALDAMISAGFRWTASDQSILEQSIDESAPLLPYCYRWEYTSDQGSIQVLFRDHDLSDRIGFRYAGISARAAVDDFLSGIEERRTRIVEHHGEEMLENAVVPVILDGENCWEHYAQNGLPFLEELYRRLAESETVMPVTFADLLEDECSPNRLARIHPGSWIAGNFDIWIGGADENRAWELLAAARAGLFEGKGSIDDGSFKRAYEHLLVAQGSDWFWWYGSQNSTENDPDFDLLFRGNLQAVYRTVDLAVPTELDRPIGRSSANEQTSNRTSRSTMQPASGD